MVDWVSVVIFLFFRIVVKGDVVFFIVFIEVVVFAVDIVRVGLVVTSIGHGRGCVVAILIGRAVVAAAAAAAAAGIGAVVPPAQQWRWTFISRRRVLTQILMIANGSTWRCRRGI